MRPLAKWTKRLGALFLPAIIFLLVSPAPATTFKGLKGNNHADRMDKVVEKAKKSPGHAVDFACGFAKKEPKHAAEIAGRVAKAVHHKYAPQIAVGVAKVVSHKYAADIAGRVASVEPSMASDIARRVSRVAPEYDHAIKHRVTDAITFSRTSFDRSKRGDLRNDGRRDGYKDKFNGQETMQRWALGSIRRQRQARRSRQRWSQGRLQRWVQRQGPQHVCASRHTRCPLCFTVLILVEPQTRIPVWPRTQA